MPAAVFDRSHKQLHQFAVFVAAVTCILIYAGGFVTTIGAGLAVPDWPLSFGSLNPAGWWRQPDVRAEHGHRLIGATVGLLTVSLAIAVWRVEARRAPRLLAIAAVAMVILQGVLGGLRVLDRNIYLAMVHACLGQLFLCLLVAIAWQTSSQWRQPPREIYPAAIRRMCALCLVTVLVQLIIGAVMRHLHAGLAIPTFPTVFGGLVPPEWNLPVGIHYLHRVWAIVTLAAVVTTAYLVRRSKPRRQLSQLAQAAVALVILQAVLGGLTVLSHRGVVLTTAHVLAGALLLATTASIALWSWRQPYQATWPD